MRRYTTLKPSHGTVIPPRIRDEVTARDRGCVGPQVGMPGDCFGSHELDHIRASGGIGMKSPSTAANLVRLCSEHHRIKTENGREWRPKLIAWIEQREDDTRG